MRDFDYNAEFDGDDELLEEQQVGRVSRMTNAR